MAGDFITADTLTGLLGDAKINDPAKGAATEQWQLDALVDYNRLRTGLIKAREHRRGAVDPDGKAFVGVGQVAADYDPFNANADGLGTSRAALMNVAGVPRWRKYTDSAGARMLHDQGVGVFQLPTLGSDPALAPAGEARFYRSSATGTWRESVNGGAWAVMAGGGGGIAAGDNVTWTGAHHFDQTIEAGAGLDVVGNIDVSAGDINLATTRLLAAGANTLISGDKLQGGHLAFSGQTAGDMLRFDGTNWVRIAAGASNTVIQGGTSPAFTNAPTVATLTTGNGSVSAQAVVVGDAGGLYRIADNQLGVSPDGTLRAEFNAGQQSLYTDILVQETSAITSGVVDVAVMRARTTGTAVGGGDSVGFGQRTLYQLEDGAGNDQDAGSWSLSWDDATNGSEDADLVLSLTRAGTLTGHTLFKGTGQIQSITAGSPSLPSYSTTSDPNTGDYSSGADEWSTSIGGTQRHRLSASRLSYKFGGASFLDSYLVEVVTDGAGASNGIRSTSAGGVGYYYAQADDPNAGAFFAHYGSGNADTFCGGSNTNSTWLKAIGGHLSVGTNTAAKNLYLGANNVEFIQCVAGGQTLLTQMFKTVAGNEQTTVGAAGGASALPATPTKYIKFKDSAGTTLIIPAYAAA